MKSFLIATVCLLGLSQVLLAQQVPKGGVSPIAELIEAGDPVAGPVIPESNVEHKPVVFPETHTIRSGDNPWTIAKDYGISMADLLSLNEIKDTKTLQIGQVLKLPKPKKKATVTSVAPAKKDAPAFEADGHEVYVIKKGDNPWTVAKRLKINYEALINLNKITNSRDLKIGQKLKLPRDGEMIATFPGALEGEAPKSPFDADGHDVYVIKPGDNPWTVAKRLNIDYQELIALNRISNSKDLKIGQKLKLPKDE